MGYTYTNAKLDEVTSSGDNRSLHGEKDMSPLITMPGRKVSWESRCEVPGASRTYVSVLGSTWLAVVGYTCSQLGARRNEWTGELYSNQQFALKMRTRTSFYLR